jgi:hypothetical protein
MKAINEFNHTHAVETQRRKRARYVAEIRR